MAEGGRVGHGDGPEPASAHPGHAERADDRARSDESDGRVPAASQDRLGAVGSSARLVLHLQRSAGNAAVTAMVRATTGSRPRIPRPTPARPSPDRGPGLAVQRSNPVAADTKDADRAQAELREKYPPLPPEQLQEISMLNSAAAAYGKIVERDRYVAAGATHEIDTIARLDAEIRTALGGQDERTFLAKVTELEGTWESRAEEIGHRELAASRAAVEAEAARYGEQDASGEVGAEADLQLADQHLAELTAEVVPVLAKEAEIREALKGEQEALDRQQREAGGEGAPSAPYSRLEGLKEEHAQLMATLRPVREQFTIHAAAYSARFPVMLSGGYVPGAFQNMDARQAGVAAVASLDETAEKIDRLDGELGGSVPVARLPRLSDAAFQTLGLVPQDPVAKAILDKKAGEKPPAERIEEALQLLALTAGALAVVATGPVGVAAAAGGAALGAGAALVDVMQQLQTMALQEAAQDSSLDPATRELFEHGDPDLVGLALTIAGFGLELVAAATAAKAVIGEVRAWRAAKTAQLAEEELEPIRKQLLDSLDANKVPPGAAQAIAPEVGAAGDAIEREVKQAAQAAGLKARLTGMWDSVMFDSRMKQIRQILDQVEGRIPQTARKFIDSKQVRPLTRKELEKAFGPARATQIWADVQGAKGIYLDNRIFLTPGSTETMTGTLIHEATHRVQDVAGRLTAGAGHKSFATELGAFMAERHYYQLTYLEPGGRLYGKTPADPHIRAMLQVREDQVVDHIVRSYMKSEPAWVQQVFGGGYTDVDLYVRRVFEDIASGWQKGVF